MVGVAIPETVAAEGRFTQVDPLIDDPRVDTVMLTLKGRNGRLYFPSTTLGSDRGASPITPAIVRNWRGKGKRVMAGVHCYDDCAPDRGRCVIERRPEGFVANSNRICPTSHTYNRFLLDVAREALRVLDLSDVHFSYFRFENLSQCYCSECLGAFAQRQGFRAMPEETLAAEIFLDSSTFAAWIDWRAEQLAAFLDGARTALTEVRGDAHVSFEVDVEHHKDYILGVKIEEGLDLLALADIAHEAVLHVHSRGWPPPDESQLGTPEEVTTKILRYLNGTLRRKRAESTLLFWNLHGPEEVSRALDISGASSANSTMFYHRYPTQLLEWLRTCL